MFCPCLSFPVFCIIFCVLHLLRIKRYYYFLNKFLKLYIIWGMLCFLQIQPHGSFSLVALRRIKIVVLMCADPYFLVVPTSFRQLLYGP